MPSVETAAIDLLPDDLHTHSTASDGALTPCQLMDAAATAGLSRLALTDHDGIDGCRQIARHAARSPDWPVLVPGVELSAQWIGVDVHIVGLGIDIDDGGLLEYLGHQRECRWQRVELIARRLARNGLCVDIERVRQLAGDGVPGRPHIARQLVESAQVADEVTAFRRWLGRGKIGDVKQLWPGIEASVGAIRAAGGVAVLAHPLKYRMTASRLRQLVGEFAEAGGGGIEILSGNQSLAESRGLVRLAVEHDLHASWGSDFHAPGPWNTLGVRGPLPVECRPVTELLDT